MNVAKVEKDGTARIILTMSESESIEVCAALLSGTICTEHIPFALNALRGIRRGGMNKKAIAASKTPIGKLVTETVMLVDESQFP